LKRSIKKIFRKDFNQLSIPPTTYARAILDEKLKKNFCDEKINALHKCIMMIVRCFFAQQIFVFFYSIYFISLVLLFCFLVKKTSQKIQWCLLTLNFLGKYLVNKRVFKSCFAELIRPNHLFFQIGFF
jgi:hypothetical protein